MTTWLFACCIAKKKKKVTISVYSCCNFTNISLKSGNESKFSIKFPKLTKNYYSVKFYLILMFSFDTISLSGGKNLPRCLFFFNNIHTCVKITAFFFFLCMPRTFLFKKKKECIFDFFFFFTISVI